MEKEVIEIGDKVICLYRKGNRREGRIHLGIGIVTHMAESGLGSYFYVVKLDRDERKIVTADLPPYGAVVPYSKELEEKMVDFHNYNLRLIIAIEDDYFENLGVKNDR